MQSRYFLVTIAPKFPSATMQAESVARYFATSNADAIKQARAEMSRAGWTRHDGPVSYRAKLDSNQSAECAAYGYE